MSKAFIIWTAVELVALVVVLLLMRYDSYTQETREI